jgi:hypothetical protein
MNNEAEAFKFVKEIRKAFLKHGDHDLNDIPVDYVIDWADEILKGSK